MTEALLAPPAQAALLATFRVRDALCAVDAQEVQEVIRVESITPVRHAPPGVAGVMNLRGKIVTLLDLGVVLGLGETTIAKESRIFIVEDRNEFLGVLVDSVGEVVEIAGHPGDAPPANTSPAQARFFKRVCRVGGRVIAVLNIREVVNERAA